MPVRRQPPRPAGLGFRQPWPPQKPTTEPAVGRPVEAGSAGWSGGAWRRVLVGPLGGSGLHGDPWRTCSTSRHGRRPCPQRSALRTGGRGW